MRSLTLLHAALKESSQHDAPQVSPSLIPHAIQSQHPVIRDLAVRCLGLQCLLKVNDIPPPLPLLMEMMEKDTPEVRLTAINVLCDLILVYGMSLGKEVAESAVEKHLSQKRWPHAGGKICDAEDGEVAVGKRLSPAAFICYSVPLRLIL